MNKSKRFVCLVLSLIIIFSIFTSTLAIRASAATTPSLLTQSKTVTAGDQFTITVSLANATSVYGGNFTLQYDKSLLTADSYSFGSIVNDHTKNCNLNYQSAGNLIRFTFSGASALSSSGTLVTLTFTAKASGTASLSFTAYKMYDQNGNAITTSVNSSTITINSNNTKKTYILADGVYYEAAKGQTFTYVYNLACDKQLASIDLRTFYDSDGLEFLPDIDSSNKYSGNEFPNLPKTSYDPIYNFDIDGEIICLFSNTRGVSFPISANGAMTSKNHLIVAQFKVVGDSGVYEINTGIRDLGDLANNFIIRNYEIVDNDTYVKTNSSITNLNQTNPPGADYMIGDVDGDREITIMDATEVQLHVAKIKILTDDNLLSADTDKDGDISIIDATQIQLFVARIITQF